VNGAIAIRKEWHRAIAGTMASGTAANGIATRVTRATCSCAISIFRKEQERAIATASTGSADAKLASSRRSVRFGW